MPKCKMIALTTPLPGREDEYNEWYQNVHLPEVVSMPGMKGAQRFKMLTKFMGQDTNEYLAVYDAEVENPADLLTAFVEKARSGKSTPTTSQDTASIYTAIFVEHGDYIEAPVD